MDLETLLDHVACPARAAFTESGERPDRHSAIRRRYSQAIHKLLYGFYHQIQSGERPNLGQLTRRWAAIWTPGKTKEEILWDVTSWRDIGKKLGNQGARVARSLVDLAPVTPVLVGYEYEVQIAGIKLKGTFDLVRERDGKIEVVDFATPFEERGPVQHDWALTAHAYAFRKLLGTRESRVVQLHLPEMTEVSATRKKSHFERLISLVRETQAMQAGYRYPAYGPACNRCPYYHSCMKG